MSRCTWNENYYGRGVGEFVQAFKEKFGPQKHNDLVATMTVPGRNITAIFNDAMFNDIFTPEPQYEKEERNQVLFPVQRQVPRHRHGLPYEQDQLRHSEELPVR